MIDIQEIDWKARKDPETRNSMFVLRPLREQLLEELKEQMPEHKTRLEKIANQGSGADMSAQQILNRLEADAAAFVKVRRDPWQFVWRNQAVRVLLTLCKRIAAIERERCGLPVPAELQVLA